MTLGFVVSFFDFRNDVRKVIEILSSDNKVIVFYKPADEEKVLNHQIPRVEYRPIFEKNRKLRNIIAEQLFLYFKKLPKSRNNYFLMELLKLSNLRSEASKRKARFILNIQRIASRLMNYDRLLALLRPSCKTEIKDIDRFILFTEIADDYFLSRLLNEKKEIVTYVYSWDHPCKHTRFSKRLKYLCWSEGIKEDIIKLQGIDPGNIRVAGASQFGYVYEFLNNKCLELPRTYPFEYIYFGCAIGIKELVPHEIKVIRQLAETTFKKKPELKFVIRPYPVLEQWSLYEELRSLQNVILDDSFRNKDLSINDAHIYSKFEKIQNSKAFLHLGTTLGLEACFTGKPSFIVDFGFESKKGLSLYAFIHQYQNDKYLVNASKKNALKSLKEYENFLSSDNEKLYLEINDIVKKEFPIKPFFEFSKSFISL
jgi:hypothetical protein